MEKESCSSMLAFTTKGRGTRVGELASVLWLIPRGTAIKVNG